MVFSPARPGRFGLARILLGLVLFATLASCGTYPMGPIPGDNKPHPGVNRARALPIQGIDISRYQGVVDFETARRGGTRFVFIKSTEGGDYLDPGFADNWARAKAAGMPRAAYHFMYWCRTASEQAAWFEKNVPNDPDALPPVLDLEWNNHSQTCPIKLDPAHALEKVKVMLDMMERYTGKLPIIYTDINFHRDVLAGHHLPNTFWLRSVAAEPHERYDERGFTFWQWTQTGTMQGVRGEVDRNAFFGTEDQWTNFLLTGCDPRALAELGPQGRCLIMK
jgi:lysozyme